MDDDGRPLLAGSGADERVGVSRLLARDGWCVIEAIVGDSRSGGERLGVAIEPPCARADERGELGEGNGDRTQSWGVDGASWICRFVTAQMLEAG